MSQETTMTELIVALFLALFLLHWAVETGLAGMNLVYVLAHPPGVPEPLAGAVAPETVRKSRDYTVTKLRFGIVRDVFRAGLVLLALFSGLLPWLEGRLEALSLEGPHLFAAYLGVLAAGSSLAGLPFSLYATFRIEARFGFNRTTPGLWIADRLKGLALSFVLGVPFLYGVHFFMEHTGAFWWLWLFGFITAVQLVLVWLYPALIAPWFNKFDPLPEGELRERLEAMAAQAGFRTRGLFVMDASRRSGHSNAYFTGFVRPRIVLFDTMLQNMSVDEALAVLAHEIGHFRKRHVHKGLVLNLCVTLALLYVLSLLVDWQPLFQAFGFSSPSTHAAVTLAMLIGGAFTFYFEPLFAWISRRREYEADAYSVRLLKLPHALKSALIRLNGENLSNLTPHPWYSAYHYSHPPLLQRLAAIDEG